MAEGRSFRGQMTDRAVSGWPSAAVRLSSGISILRERVYQDVAHFAMLLESYFLRFGMSKVIIAGEAQGDRETFVFTVEPCSFAQSRLGKLV